MLVWSLIIQSVPLIIFFVVSMVQAAKELRSWSENRMLDCIFCMDYDDYQRLSIFGCVGKNPVPSCRGNACYMRQHKKQGYFLYTSGCLNLTQTQFDHIQIEISKAKAEPKVQKAHKGIETQLCEVTKIINTCLCTNRPFCNNVSSMEPFTEYSSSLIFGNTNFDEVAHFRYFLPNDPILKPMQQGFKDHDKHQYLIPKSLNGLPLRNGCSHSVLFANYLFALCLLISLHFSVIH